MRLNFIYQVTMLSFYQLKPYFQQSLHGIVSCLARLGVTANQITLLVLLLSTVVGTVLFYAPNHLLLWRILPIFLFVRMALNAIDGMLAKQKNQQSALGGLLNEVGDLISDVALFLPFTVLPSANIWLLFAAILLAWMTEFVGVCAVMVGSNRRYDGPMGKSDRAFVIGVCALLFGFGLIPAAALNYVWCALCVLLVITVLNRACKALKSC